MNKRRLATTAVAAFGAAMTSMYAAPELQADILDLTFNVNSLSFPGGVINGFVEVPGFSFQQFNDGLGKSIYSLNFDGVQLANESSTLNASTFVGGSFIGIPTTATGTAFVGFSFGGNVGWFSLNLGGAGGTITYLDGEYGDAGESVHVGGTTVIPEPTSLAALGVLALGAAGVRRNRRK